MDSETALFAGALSAKIAPEMVAQFAIDQAAEAINALNPSVSALVQKQLRTALAHCVLFPAPIAEASALVWPIIADALNARQAASAEYIAQKMQEVVATIIAVAMKQAETAFREAQKMRDLVSSSKEVHGA